MPTLVEPKNQEEEFNHGLEKVVSAINERPSHAALNYLCFGHL
jgi:hypothetical protein